MDGGMDGGVDGWVEGWRDGQMDGDGRYKAWLVPREIFTKAQNGKWHGPLLTLMCECHLVVCLELHPSLPTPRNTPSYV